MIDRQSILAIIPARGASRGLPGKNGKRFCGKPLLTWTIEAAKRSGYIDEIIVSTDSAALAGIAAEHGVPVPFMRPPELATDQARTTDVIYHVVTTIRTRTGRVPDHIILLQPTSPLRGTYDIDHALEKYFKIQSELLISVTHARQNPFWMKIRTSGDKLGPFLPDTDMPHQRQLLPELYYPNGAIYIVKTEVFLASRSLGAPEIDYYLMPSERSIDIDSEFDFKMAELCMTKVIEGSKPADV